MISDNVTKNTSYDLTKYCRITYEFIFTIIGENAPGEVEYKWKRDNGNWHGQESVEFNPGQTEKEVAYSDWQLNRNHVGDHTITLRTMTPNQQTKVYPFTHSCGWTL